MDLSESSKPDYYVYVLIDPRDNKEFYVGKGKGRRKDAHDEDERDSAKTRQIRAIREAGSEHLKRVVVKGLTQDQALMVESTLIWMLREQLTNEIAGHSVINFRNRDTLASKLPGFDFQHDLYHFNVGDTGAGGRRSWEDCRKYGFLAAGSSKGDSRYRRQIQVLNREDVVAAYLNGRGYVGVGIVQEEAVIASNFSVDGVPLAQLELTRPRILEFADDRERAEYIVRVKWIASCGSLEARSIRKTPLTRLRPAKVSLRDDLDRRAFISTAFGINLDELLEQNEM